MKSEFRILLLLMAILTTFFIVHSIRKSKMQIKDTLFWFFISFILIFMSIFPKTVSSMGEFLGIQSTVNFVFLVIIFLLLIRLFLQSVKISQLEDRLDLFIQKCALERYKRKDESITNDSNCNNDKKTK